MTIQVGDRIPAATLSYLKDGVQQISSDELWPSGGLLRSPNQRL